MVLCLNLKHLLKYENKVKNLHCMYVMSYFYFIKSVSVVRIVVVHMSPYFVSHAASYSP